MLRNDDECGVVTLAREWETQLLEFGPGIASAETSKTACNSRNILLCKWKDILSIRSRGASGRSRSRMRMGNSSFETTANSPIRGASGINRSSHQSISLEIIVRGFGKPRSNRWWPEFPIRSPCGRWKTAPS
jgi:hypothetical protein